MRMFLNLCAALLLSAMLAEPVLAHGTHGLMSGADLGLAVLGLAGVLIGRHHGRAADVPARRGNRVVADSQPSGPMREPARRRHIVRAYRRNDA
ncbi:MAG TPA: hypothetical protein VN222_17350 [Novosphingobium sp.]|nr:hypothetical protein [Novosphingobium sp.]